MTDLPRLPRLAIRLLLLAVAACLLYSSVTSIANELHLARVPYQFDYEEGNILNTAVRLNAGLTPYPPPGSWPVVLNCYGPIPYLVAARMIRNGEPNLYHPRIVSMIAVAIIAIEIAALVACFTQDNLLAFIFGAFFLTLPLVQQWSPLLRVDPMALALSLGGLVVFFRMPRFSRAVPVFFVLALLSKVTFIAAPITCALILARRKRWRELGSGILVFAVLLGASLAVLQWRTHGAFFFHQFGTHPDPFSWANRRLYANFLRDESILIALSLVAALRTKRMTDPLIFTLVAFLVTFTVFKLGSNDNHFLELSAALCIFAGVGLHELRNMEKLPLASFIVIAICGFILARQGIADRAYFSSKGVVDGCAQAYAYIGEHQQVLSENITALVLTRRPVLLSNPFVYAQLVRSGKWPAGRVERMLQQSAADLVMIGKPTIMEQRWTQPALDALAANYHVSHRFACVDAIFAYEPNSHAQISSKGQLGEASGPPWTTPH